MDPEYLRFCPFHWDQFEIHEVKSLMEKIGLHDFAKYIGKKKQT